MENSTIVLVRLNYNTNALICQYHNSLENLTFNEVSRQRLEGQQLPFTNTEKELMLSQMLEHVTVAWKNTFQADGTFCASYLDC